MPRQKVEVQFSEAPEVSEIAWELIEEYHEGLSEAKIRYLSRSGKSWASKGKTVLGRARKLSGELRHFTGDFDFLIVVNREHWLNLTPGQKRALVDHELCHCGRTYRDDGGWTWTVVPHDTEEFAGVIRRHGLWQEDVKLLAKAIRECRDPQQATLFDPPAATEAAATAESQAGSEVQ